MAAYALALAIFLVSNVRSSLFHLALQAQPHFAAPASASAALLLDALGYALLVVGGVLVAGAYYRSASSARTSATTSASSWPSA